MSLNKHCMNYLLVVSIVQNVSIKWCADFNNFNNRLLTGLKRFSITHRGQGKLLHFCSWIGISKPKVKQSWKLVVSFLIPSITIKQLTFLV